MCLFGPLEVTLPKGQEEKQVSPAEPGVRSRHLRAEPVPVVVWWPSAISAHGRPDGGAWGPPFGILGQVCMQDKSRLHQQKALAVKVPAGI